MLRQMTAFVGTTGQVLYNRNILCSKMKRNSELSFLKIASFTFSAAHKSHIKLAEIGTPPSEGLTVLQNILKGLEGLQ